MPAQDRPLHYHSGRTDAPVLTGQVGTLENLLYRCLVDGFNTRQATTLTRSGTTATFTKTAHGFTDYDWIVVAGADQAEYNGIFQILPGATSSTFQYTITGSPVSPATGTITAKFLPLGWTRELSSGNKAIFKANAFTSSGVEFRLDDNGTGTQSYRTSFIRGCYGHTDIDTLTYPIFPTVAQQANGLVIHKSTTLDGVARDWDIYGNGRFFYIFISYHPTYAGVYNTIFFGDIISAVPAPAYPGCIQAVTSETIGSPNYFHNIVSSLNATSTGKYMATAYNQIGDPVAIGAVGNTNATGSTYMGINGMPSPNPASNGYSMCHVFLTDGNYIIGKMPGIFHIWHDRPFSHRSIMPEFPSLAGRRIMLMATGAPTQSNTGRVPIDLTGPLYD